MCFQIVEETLADRPLTWLDRTAAARPPKSHVCVHQVNLSTARQSNPWSNILAPAWDTRHKLWFYFLRK
jgi:hypothetical protein